MTHKLPYQPNPPQREEFGPNFSSKLPLVFVIYSNNGSNLFNGPQPVSICVIDNSQTHINHISDLPEAKVLSAEMHVRGESTRSLQKVQYSVKLKKSEKHPHFLGMKYGGKHWVFNDAGAVDFTYMRNPMAFQMERNLGAGQWAPRTRYFELFLAAGPEVKVTDRAAIVSDAYKYYQGIYINMEKIRKEKHRINIAKYKAEKPTAGHVGDLLLQVNHVDKKYVSLNSTIPNVLALGVEQLICYEPHAAYFKIHSNEAPPSIPSPPPKQLDPILKWWKDWARTVAYTGENAKYWISYKRGTGIIYSPERGFSSKTGISTKLESQFDFPSFAAYFLMAEIAKDPDGYHRSTFMWKQKDKVHAGPMWDKNKSYGNIQALSNTDWYVTTSGWTLYGKDNPILPTGAKKDSNSQNPNQAPAWWQILLSDKNFCRHVSSIWEEERKKGGAFHASTIKDHLNTNKTLLKQSGAAERDIKLWHDYTVEHWENMIENKDRSPCLFTYLEDRLKWIDENLHDLLKSTSGV